jgi:putative membrane protein
MVANFASLVVALVAILHIAFLVLEMIFWEKALGMRVFRQTPERAAVTRALAMNQGLYNGFLAAGLIWGLLADTGNNEIRIFFLSCVIVAGVFGAATVSRKILWIQAAPAVIGLVLVLLS